MRARLVCFVGTDGSGKSTASDAMLHTLSKKGITCRKIWGAYELRFFRFAVKSVKRLMLKNPSPYGDYSKYKDDVAKATRRPFVTNVYTLMVFCEYWLQIFFNVTVPMSLGKTVVSDRYVYDTVINMSSNLGLDPQAFKRKLERWIKFFPKPDLVIYVEVPPEVSMARKDDIPDIEYVRKRHEYYRLLAGSLCPRIVDGTTPIKAIRDEMVTITEEVIR